MALLGLLEDEEYNPDYSAVVVRDSGQAQIVADDVLGPASEWLSEHAAASGGGDIRGSIARSGIGWLFAVASDSYQRVRLEAHDAVPPSITGAPVDVVELPYFCGSGVVCLTRTVPDEERLTLKLQSPGLFRVRVVRRLFEDGESGWVITFWPDSQISTPRWWRRALPAVGRGRSDWDEALARQAFTLFIVMEKAGDSGFTLEEFDARGAKHWGTGWLDEPFYMTFEDPLPTGHAAMDEQLSRHVESQRAEVEQSRDMISTIAAQLGLGRPETHRDLLAILVAGGAFVADGEPARYRQPADAPRAREVLTLPTELVMALDRRDADVRYAGLAADLVCIAGWALGQPTSVAEIGDRLDATEPDVQAAIDYAVAAGLLTTTAATGAGTGTQLTMVPALRPAARRSPPRNRRQRSMSTQPGPRPAAPAARPGPARSSASVLRPNPDKRTAPFSLPFGAPPRAGYVTHDGRVIRNMEHTRHVVARLGSQSCIQALETAAGIAVFGAQYGVMAHEDGVVTDLALNANPYGTINRTGTKLAFVTENVGRHRRHDLRVMDVRDGTHIDMPSAQKLEARPAGFIGDTLYFFTSSVRGGRWQLGGAPELTDFRPTQIDPFTNVILGHDQEPGLVILHPDGRQQRVLLSDGYLVPGATHVWSFHAGALDLFDVNVGAASIRTIAFGAAERQQHPWPGNQPVWEDKTHMLVAVGSRWNGGVLRIDIDAGSAEVCTLDGDEGAVATPIAPLPPAGR